MVDEQRYAAERFEQAEVVVVRTVVPWRLGPLGPLVDPLVELLEQIMDVE